MLPAGHSGSKLEAFTRWIELDGWEERMRRIALLIVGASIASMTLLSSPASAADVCVGGKYEFCVCTENCYCFETINNVYRAFFGRDIIICH